MTQGLSKTGSAFAAGILAVTLATLAACGGVSKRPDRGHESAFVPPHVAAFERNPNAANFESLHADLLMGPISSETDSRIVAVLASKDVPRNVLDAIAVDLATLDWGGTMEWAQKLNVVARSDSSPQGARMVRNTSRLAWLMLTLRANYAVDLVDLSHADLKTGAPSVGQAMNLANVDFSGSELAGTTWHNSNLTNAIFGGTVVAGALRCTNCTFGTMQYPGTVTLTDGKWVPR
ncbi:MAG: pentapeptide repeat-containing protein [Candidatus Tumulicola sp.]